MITIFANVLEKTYSLQTNRFKLCPCSGTSEHLSELCERVEVRTRASARGDLTVQRTRTKFGERAFIVAGPATWNRLPSTFAMLHP